MKRHAVRGILGFTGRSGSLGLASGPVHLAAKTTSNFTHASLPAKLSTLPLLRENLRIKACMCSLNRFLKHPMLPIQFPKGPLEGGHDIVEGGEVKGILEGISIL